MWGIFGDCVEQIYRKYIVNTWTWMTKSIVEGGGGSGDGNRVAMWGNRGCCIE